MQKREERADDKRKLRKKLFVECVLTKIAAQALGDPEPRFFVQGKRREIVTGDSARTGRL